MVVMYRDPHAPAAAPAYHVRFTTSDDDVHLQDQDGCWAGAQTVAWGPAEYRTQFRALWTGRALCVRFDCRDPAPWHTMTRRDDHLWEEEVVEIFIDPPGTGEGYAEIEINPANVVCDLRIRRPWPALAGEIDWHFPGLATRAYQRPALDASGPGWTAVAVLPWAGFGSLSPSSAARVPPSTGDRWRFNLFRIKRPGGPADRERGAVYAAWAVPTGPSFHDPSVFRELVFCDR